MAQAHLDQKIANSFPLWKRIPLPILLAFTYFIILSTVNLYIGLQVLRNPGSFPSSYWDIRWSILFAVSFCSIGILAFIKKSKLLITLTLIGCGGLILLPIVTIGAGKAYLVIVLLVLIALGIGETTLRFILRDKISDVLDRFILAVLVGMGILAILVMIQGMLFAYSSLVTWLGLAILFLVFVIPSLKRWSEDVKHPWTTLSTIWSGDRKIDWAYWLAVLLVIWIPSWLIALAPANRYDEMTYHLAAPMTYLRYGGIVQFPEGGLTYWMHYAEMLYTLGLQTAGQPLPRMLHLLMGILTAGLVFLFGRRLVSTRFGIIAATLFFAVPVIGYETSTAYIDLFITAYTTAFGYTLLIWWQERNPRWLLVAGVMGGFGLGTKLTAGPMIAGLSVALAIILISERRLSKNLPWVGAMMGLILIIAVPWLIRDMAWTGDPFYPYGRMFLDKVSSAISASEPSTTGLSSNRFLGMLRYPIDLVFNSYKYYREAPGGFASALPLLAFPVFAFFSKFSRKIKVIGVGLLGVNFLALGITFIVNSALLRYSIPILPWLAICAALNLEGIFDWFLSRESKWGIILFSATMLVYVFSTRLPIIMRQYDNLPQRLPLNYFLGRETSDNYLSRTLAVYDAYKFVDSQPDGPHRVLSIGNEFRLYTLSRIDGIYDVTEVSEMVSGAATPADLAQLLKMSGYDYLLVNQEEVDFVQWKYVDPYPILQNLDFWNSYCQLVFAKNGIYIYRFFPDGIQLPNAVNLLENDGFEDVGDGNDLTHWEEFGSLELSDQAYQGEYSLLLHAPLSANGGGYVMQKVPVESGKFYTLGYWIRSDQTATFLMQIRWIDDQGNFISDMEDWKSTTTEWHWYSLYGEAPNEAKYAEVFASLGGSENAFVDTICLAQGQRCPIK